VRKKMQYIVLVKYATTTWYAYVKIMKLSVNTWFRVVSWIITSSGASTVWQPRTKSIIDDREEENMNADHVYSHHDDRGDYDIGENDEGPDVEQMWNVVSDVLPYLRGV
jgi:hypothetical protein